jgi:hypothetical protein
LRSCSHSTFLSAFKLISHQGNTTPVPKLGENIVNLSNYPLSEIETRVLDKGLNFIPTPKHVAHTPILEAAARFFGRSLKLGYHFRKTKNSFGSEKFIHKSNWEPADKSIKSDILETIKEIHDDLSNLRVPTHKQNISNAEFTALKGLKNNPYIIIKPADKGSATVIMDKENYVSEGNRQLSNSIHYKRLNEPIFQNTASKIDDILQDLHDNHYM